LQGTSLRDEYLSLLANGIDPQVHNNDKANALKDATEHTFQAVAKKWLDEKVKTSGISQTMLTTSGEALNEIFSPVWVMCQSMRSVPSS
jgi:hypothetical protein